MSKLEATSATNAKGQPVTVFMAEHENAPNGGTTYTIGDLAREFGVTLRTLRFYEDKGLLNPTRDNLTRLYSARDREHLQLILKGKRLGFTLVEIGEMIAHHGEGKTASLDISANTVRDQIEHLERQRREIDEALVELRRSYEGLASALQR
jgi:DNA-binding transcriptional MerR regulator